MSMHGCLRGSAQACSTYKGQKRARCLWSWSSRGLRATGVDARNQTQVQTVQQAILMAVNFLQALGLPTYLLFLRGVVSLLVFALIERILQLQEEWIMGKHFSKRCNLLGNFNDSFLLDCKWLEGRRGVRISTLCRPLFKFDKPDFRHISYS
jgi:hypothetical protein